MGQSNQPTIDRSQGRLSRIGRDCLPFCVIIQWNGKDMSAETLTEQTYLKIRRELISGQLKPGQKLISRSLASRHGVSLAPVREAIGRLAAEGLVDHIPGAGSFVKTVTKHDLYELYILREGLESCAAAEAATNAHPLQIEALSQLCDRFDQLASQVVSETADQTVMNRWIDAEETFHEVLLEASRNSLLNKVCSNYRMQLQVFELQRKQPMILTQEIAAETSRMHRAIFNAVKDRNSEQARLLMLEHIQAGRKSILGYF